MNEGSAGSGSMALIASIVTVGVVFTVTAASNGMQKRPGGMVFPIEGTMLNIITIHKF